MEPVIQTFEYLSGLLNFQNSPWCLDEAMKFTKKSPFNFKKYLKLIVSKIGANLKRHVTSSYLNAPVDK